MLLRPLRRLALLALWLCPLSAAAGEPVTAEAPTVINAEPAPLAARYEISRGQQRGKWYLWRSPGQVETRSELQQRSEIWQWDAARQLSYQRYFHREQTYVDYTAGQLLTQRIQPDPARLASLIDPALLQNLRRGRSVKILGRTAVQYQGRHAGQNIELLWLPQERVPALLRQSGPGGTLSLRLRELHARSPASWPRVSEQMIASYARIDGADLGDMEHDPFVAGLLAESGHEEHGTGHRH